MEQHYTGYGAATPNYGYGQDGGYGSYLSPAPPVPSSYGNTTVTTYPGHYDTFGSGYDQPAPAYQPTGSYGAVGEPVKPVGYAQEQFASPSQEPSWQDYNSYSSNTQEYGRDVGNGYDGQVGYSNFSAQENYQQESAPPSYELGQGFNNNRGKPSFSGNQERGGRVGFDGTDGYTRGGRGAMRGRGRGYYGHEGQFEDANMGSGKFDGGSSRGRGGRGGVVAGRGDFNSGTRGRGLFDSGNRGRGQFGGDTRGRGQFGGDTRGRGQFGGDTRGRGQFGRDTRGRGQFGGLTRGRGATSRGRGSFDGGQSVRESFRGGSRGRGEFGSGSRGRGGRGQVGKTRGRGWVPAGSSSLGQDASRGRGQYGARGNKQTVNRGRGQDTASGRGQQVGAQAGLQAGATRGGLVSVGRGRGDGGGFSTPATKATKPFKMSSADAQGFISYKNNLQEYAQKNHKPIPQYTSQKADIGFTATVSVDGQMYSCLQSQREKKDAEQGAAFEALKALGYIDANDTYSPKLGTGKAKKRPSEDGDVPMPNAKVARQEQPATAPPPMSYKSKLNERIMKMRLDLPTYSTVRTAGGFLSTLVLNGQVYQGVKPFGTKKLAEQHVAEIVFTQLNFKVEATPGEAVIVVGSGSDAVLSSPEAQKELSATTSTSSKPPSASKAKPMKNIVQEYCQKSGMQIPIYNSVKDAGMFIATVTVNGVEYVGTPHIMKKTAEQNAAKKVCEELGLKF